MEVLMQTSGKSKYDMCKYQIKLWENEFKQKTGRLPSKVDFREANLDVRKAYKIYYQLKTFALEKSLTDIDGFIEAEDEVESIPPQTKQPITDDVNTEKTWGTHLNKQQEGKGPNGKLEKVQVNSSFTEKLFKGIKPFKRFSRRSLSSNKRKSQTEIVKPDSIEQPNPIETNLSNLHSLDSMIFQDPHLKVVAPTTTLSSVPLHLLNTSNYKSVRNIDKNWVDRVGQSQSFTDNICESDEDVIESSDDEEKTQILKKSRSEITHINHDDHNANFVGDTTTTLKKLDFCNIFANDKCPSETFISDSSNNIACPGTNETTTDAEKNSSSLNSYQTCSKINSFSFNSLNSEEQQAEHKSKTTPKDIYRFQYEELITSNITVPTAKNVEQKVRKLPDKTESVSSQQENAREKRLLKKLQSNTINENFVKIDIKKKVFVRGRKKQTFSNFKKQMWRNKKKALYNLDMNTNGSSESVLTCFNCGGTGHFARKCKSAKEDKLLPVVNSEDEDPHPTLDEAAKIAKSNSVSNQNPNNDETSDDHTFSMETTNIEEEMSNIIIPQPSSNKTFVKPYYEDSTMTETPSEVFKALHKFGHESFRGGQEKAILRILSGKSTLVTLGTGSGKSLCYQLPIYLYSKKQTCISLVVSPLVSLMEDQVSGIPEFMKAVCLHTNQTKAQREKASKDILEGDLDILFVSPETVVAGERSSGFGALLYKLPPIAFACIDEAHCVSQWSHNFRPSYLKVCHVLREQLGVKTILGLTATATESTRDSIIKHLDIPDGKNGIISDVPIPSNLRLSVSRDANKDQALLTILMSEPFVTHKSIIIYCTRREECERVATLLRTTLPNKDSMANYNNGNRKRKRYSVIAETYHAGMSAGGRKRIQKTFMSGELRIVVATVAFGMGINKADIRSVIHYNMPMNLESYVQEIGRAGRDGLPAHCHLFLDSKGTDLNELSRHVYGNSVDRHIIRKLLKRCFLQCSCDNSPCSQHEVAFSIDDTVQSLDIPSEHIETILCYLELDDRQYIKLLSNVYTTCKIISYAGPQVIKETAKNCPPLALALKLYKKEDKENNVFKFPVVEVAVQLGMDSGMCKYKLKNLEWTTENNRPKRSKLTVEFENLGFHLHSSGNLSLTEQDEMLDKLCQRIIEQERNGLLQLKAIHETLKSVAKPTVKMCLEEKDLTESEKAFKERICEYFESSKPLVLFSEMVFEPLPEERIVGDIRNLISMYRDTTFTGRAIARIFYGIQSPNYPAMIWKRCKFWRAHIGFDFNAICKLADREILRMR